MIRGYIPKHSEQKIKRDTRQYRNNFTLISAIIATLWMIVSISAFLNIASTIPTGDSAEAIGSQIGATIGILSQMPYLILMGLGIIFDWVGYWTNKQGFVLTSAILFCVALLFSIFNGLGLIPCFILDFIGYSKMKKER